MSAEIFSPAQRRAVGGALTVLAVGAAAALVVFALVSLGQAVGYFSGVLWPLAVAGVLALILRPIVAFLEVRLRLRRLAAVFLLYGVFLLTASGTLLLVMPPLVDQLLDFIAYVPELWQNADAYLSRRYPEWLVLIQRAMENPALRKAADALTAELNSLLSHALPTLKAAGTGALGVVAFATHLAIIPVYLFFFLLARGETAGKLHRHLEFLGESARDDVVFLISEFVGIVESFFRGQMLIGFVMGVLLSVGFTLIGLKFGLVLGLAIGVLNIVPYLGTIIGLGVALPLAFFQPGGGWPLVGLVLGVKFFVQALESWVLTPRIMGERTGLHPVAIIVAIFFWGTALGGVLGMLLAVPLTAFFVTAWRLARRKFFHA